MHPSVVYLLLIAADLAFSDRELRARAAAWASDFGPLLRLLLGGPLFPAAQLGGIRIGRRARTENPASNQPEEQYGGDIDEVSGRHGSRRRQETVGGLRRF